MNYFIIAFKIIIIEYFILFIHELIHYIASLLLKFKTTSFYLIPFNIYKEKSKYKFKIAVLDTNFITSRLHFDSINLYYKFEYSILLNKLRVYFWIGPIFDFIIFVILFSIGVSNVSYSYLALISLIHFAISTFNFFNNDGKYAIGLKEDNRIAFDIVRNYSICGNGKVSYKSKGILTDIYIEIAKNITIEPFDVNDLWNFLNNISFYTNSLLSYLNKDIFTLDPSTIDFFNILMKDFDNIKKYDYRQVEKTSISLLYYFIYKKIIDTSFTPNEELSNKVFKGLNHSYYKNIYLLFFNNKINNLDYLLKEKNMPPSIYTIEGQSKLLINLVNIYKDTLA